LLTFLLVASSFQLLTPSTLLMPFGFALPISPCAVASEIPLPFWLLQQLPQQLVSLLIIFLVVAVSGHGTLGLHAQLFPCDSSHPISHLAVI
jgi:hypothetical protein